MLQSELPMARRTSLPILILPILLFGSCDRAPGFRHGAHVTLAKGECALCHGEDSDLPRKAEADDCLACHPNEKRFLPPSGLAAKRAGQAGAHRSDAGNAPGKEEEVPFSHRRHRLAGIACGQCHPSPPGKAEPPRVPAFPECGGCH